MQCKRIYSYTTKMAAKVDVSHVQAKFFTKQSQYAVDDSPFSVPSSVGAEELQNLINGLLKSVGDVGDPSNVKFDFLIEGVFLSDSLEVYIKQHDISTEAVLAIEYVERTAAPAPEDSLLHDDWVAAVRAHRDFILTGCYDNTMKMWDTGGKPLLTISGHTAPVKCVCWIGAGEDGSDTLRFLSGSHDATVLMWHWSAAGNAIECIHACRGHAGSVDCVAVAPNAHRFCSGSWDKMLKIWSTDSSVDNEETQTEGTGDEPARKKKKDSSRLPSRVPLMTLSGHNEGVSAASWLNDSEVCTASWDHTIRLWDIERAAEKSLITGSKVYLDVAYSPLNNLLVAASADRHVRLYDPRITDGAVVQSTFTSHTGWISAVAWSPTSSAQFISGAYDGILKLWDTRSPKAPLYDMKGHEDKILAADWSIPNLAMSGAADNNVKIFKMAVQHT